MNYLLGDEVLIDGSNILTCAGKTFGSLKVGDHITYNLQNDASPRLHRISAISADLKSLTLAATTAVSGVNVATLSSVSPTGIRKAIPVIQDEGNGLFAQLENKNVSDVSLTNSDLSIKTQITGVSIGATGVFSANITDTDLGSGATFETFDEDRYSVHVHNGAIAPLTSDQIEIKNNGQTLLIQGLVGLTTTGASVVVNATVRKNDIKVKQKSFDRSKKVNVTLTNSGISTANGLTQNTTAFGLRVEDKIISLNNPDVVNVVGVYESLTTSNPVLDRLVFVSGLALNTASVIGEKITGSVSGAIAQITDRVSATIVEIAYLTQNKFAIGETVTFEESNIITNLQGITEGSYSNITSSYTLDKGQKQGFYDYSRIVRNAGERAPNRRLTIVYNHYTVPSNDTGDVYTVGSYDEERFSKDIPSIGDVRSTDTLDFRPRVAEFTSTTTFFSI